MRVRAASYTSGNGVVISSTSDMNAGTGKIKIGDIFAIGSYIKTNSTNSAVKNTKLQIYNTSQEMLVNVKLSEGYTFTKAIKVVSVTYKNGGSMSSSSYQILYEDVQLDATVSTAPTAASLTYTGSAQTLLSNGGSANNGTMVYALGSDATTKPADTAFAGSIPKGTNAGSYYVWYMAKGNTGYSNSAKSCKTVTIAKATPTASMIPDAPTASAVNYGTKLSAVTLSNNWSWVDANASSIVPNVENSGYVAKYNGSIDTSNYDWTKYNWNTAAGWSFNSTTNKIQKKVVVPVTAIPKPEVSFIVPTNLSATYNSSKTLSDQMSLPTNWAWKDGTVTPQVSDTTFTAVYTVPSPDNKNYTWNHIDGYESTGSAITITRDLPVTINKATQTATVNMENYDFGGNISTPTITGAQESPTVTYYYNTENSNEGGTEWKDMISTTLDKGTYYMYATLSATDNYAAYTTPTKRFIVNPKTMTGITAQSVDVPYDGAEHSITVSGYPEGATVSYGESAGTYDLARSPAYKDARDTAYTVYFKITAKGYNDYTGSATVKISPKVAELSWGDTAFTYDGSIQTPSALVSNLCGDDACTVTVSGGKKDYSSTVYTATATALSNPNYKLPVAEADRQTSFTIAQKQLGITWGDTEFTYNGRAQKPTAALVGVVSEDTCNVTVSGEKTDVGTDYTATASIDNDNYKLPENATKLFTISPKSLKADTVTVTLSGTGITGNVTDGYAFVWDGNRKSPVITVTDNETGSDLVYETDFTVSGTEDARNIGTYYITLTGAGNYTNKVKITWKITKAIITPSVSLAGWVYGDTPNEPQIIGAEITGDVTYTYYKDEACTVKTTAADGATENGGVPACAGSYYVKADVAETQNYEAVSTKTSFTISKKDVTVTPKSGQKKTYGEYDPELTYNAVLVGDDTLTGSLDRVEGENVGSYSITQGTLANSNYNIIFTTGVTFSIEQKQLTDDMLSLDPVNYTYTGATVSPTVCYHDDTTKVDGTNITEADIDKYGAKRASDYGVYTIELEGKGNYKGTIYKQWCISPVQDVTVTYDGDPHKIAYSTGAGFDLKFKDADGNYTLTDVSEQTMPGVYRYDYRMVIDEETIDGYAVLTINKIPFVGTLNMSERIGYGETLNPSVTGCSSDGDITYYYKKQGQLNSAYAETKPVNVGNYTVKAVVDATATQAGGTLTKDFEITKGTLTPVNPDKAVYACRDNGTKSVTLHDSYNELDGVSYTLGDVTDGYDILADSSVSVSRTGEVSYTLTGSSTVDAEAVIKVIIKSTNYEDITVDVTIGVDASVPEITGVTDGKTYCTAQTITVEDDSLDKVEINGTEVTLTSENTYTLAATGTTYIIKATDRAGNSSTVTVTVNNGHTWQNNPVFTWNGCTSATARFTCSVDASHTEDKNCTISHVTTPAKCLVDGKRVYTASVTVDGTTYTDTNPNEEVLTATGHHWVYDAEGDTLYAWCSGDCAYHGTCWEDAAGTLKITATSRIYNRLAYESENASVIDGISSITGEAIGTITYYLSDGVTKTGTDTDTKSGATGEGAVPKNAGSYYAGVTVGGKTAKAAFTIEPKTITADMISLDHADKKYTVTGGTITPSVTVKDGEVILENGETKDYVLSGETSHAQYGTHSITVTGKGNYTGSSTVAWNITDPYAPSGAIAIVSKTWNSFPAGTDFGYFFKDTQRVTLSATDGREESGVDKVYYCKSLTPCTTTEQLAAVTWTEIANGGSFYINPNANVYIYAKIADKAGNVTYLASDGMVLYTDSARATESITYTKTSTADVTADVVLNGNTISNITLGDTTLVKGSDYTISENGATIAFKASFLQTLAARDAAYTLKVSYNPGGKTFVEAAGNDRPLDTTIDLTVEKAQGSLTDISDISKIYDGLSVTEPTFSTTNDKGTDNANVTFAYKKKNAADSTYTAEKPIDAGTYIVKITVAADDNYKAVSNTAEFVILKANISASATDYESVYDGAAHGITVDVTGMTDAYTVSYGVMPEEADAQITYGETPVTYEDVGTYTVYYKVSSANYNDSFGSAKVKISPKTIGISWSDTTSIYDGEEHMPTAVATGLVGDDACSITVTGGQKHVGATYTATATAVSNPNYQLPEDVTTEFAIVPAELTVTAEDAAKHIGKNDPEYTYKITAGALVEGDSLSGISLSRTAGETAGEYAITAAEQSGSNPDYHITFVPGTLTIEDHVAAVDAAVAPTCTETGFAEGSHCSVCDAVLVPQETVPALGHDWSGEWKVTREATATEDGRREITCKRDGCGHKKYDTIPAIGTEEPEDPNAGDIEKYADVSADSPIPEAALGNKKEELLEAPGIFTPEEKEAIRAGADAKVWLEVTKTDEASIPADAKAKMTDVAKQIMGDNLEVVYFDAGLYKQINGGSVTELHEPGIGIRVTVRLPEQLLNHDKSISREYKILRLHNGDVTVLGAVFHEATGELTFETDKFSTYAIAYSDKKLVTEVEEPSKEDTVTTTDSPATGDAAEPLYWMMIMLLSLGAVVFVRRKKEDKQ